MNTSRLRRAIEIMREVEAKELPFDMNNWLSHFDEGTVPPFGNREHTCGTAACMFGWCGLDEGFQKEGLQIFVSFFKGDPDGENYEENELINPTIVEQNRLLHEEGWKIGSTGVRFEGQRGENAAAKFFDISLDAAIYLTLPQEYESSEISPEDVIEHLEAVLDGIFDEPEEEEDEDSGEENFIFDEDEDFSSP